MEPDPASWETIRAELRRYAVRGVEAGPEPLGGAGSKSAATRGMPPGAVGGVGGALGDGDARRTIWRLLGEIARLREELAALRSPVGAPAAGASLDAGEWVAAQLERHDEAHRHAEQLFAVCEHLEVDRTEEIVPALQSLVGALRQVPELTAWARDVTRVLCGPHVAEPLGLTSRTVLAAVQKLKDERSAAAAAAAQATWAARAARRAQEAAEARLQKMEQAESGREPRAQAPASALSAIEHFQALFGVRSVSGCVPMMDFLYLQQQRIRELLGLAESSTLQCCVAALERQLRPRVPRPR